MCKPLIEENHEEKEKLHYNSQVTRIIGMCWVLDLGIILGPPLRWGSRSIYA